VEMMCRPDLALALAKRAMLALLACALSGCGQKGPLYLPDQAREIVTRPAPPPLPATDASAPQTVDTPATADEPTDGKEKKRSADQQAIDPAAAPR
jgi:predicted small lipoprotein YifL